MSRSSLALAALLAVPLVSCTEATLPTATPEQGATAPATAADGAVSAATKGGRPGTQGVVYVTSQNLYYDTFVTSDPLPMRGRFQLLANGQTEFGPGDPGYLGGRWWEDLNGNGVQDAGDHFFHCPLLPQGRPTP